MIMKYLTIEVLGDAAALHFSQVFSGYKTKSYVEIMRSPLKKYSWKQLLVYQSY